MFNFCFYKKWKIKFVFQNSLFMVLSWILVRIGVLPIFYKNSAFICEFLEFCQKIWCFPEKFFWHYRLQEIIWRCPRYSRFPFEKVTRLKIRNQAYNFSSKSEPSVRSCSIYNKKLNIPVHIQILVLYADFWDE